VGCGEKGLITNKGNDSQQVKHAHVQGRRITNKRRGRRGVTFDTLKMSACAFLFLFWWGGIIKGLVFKVILKAQEDD